MIVATQCSTKRRILLASGVLNAVQQFASAAGIALVGTLFLSTVARGGFTVAFGRSLRCELVVLLACVPLIFLLPVRLREEVR